MQEEQYFIYPAKLIIFVFDFDRPNFIPGIFWHTLLSYRGATLLRKY